MSHVPLIARQSVPKLHPTRRGPQLVLLCVLVTVAFLLLPRGAYDALEWNATRVRVEEPPPELVRIIGAGARREIVTPEMLKDLLVTVAYLADQAVGTR